MKKLILSVAAGFLLLTACGKKERPANPGQPQAQAQENAPASENEDTYFKLPAAAGGEIDLHSYAGKPVLLMFFTETCPYCRKAGPAMETLYLKYSPKGMNFVGIDLDDNAAAPNNFAKDLGVTFPLAYNGIDVSRQYRTQGVPYIFLLDGGHKVYDVWEGYDESYLPEITKTIETLLSGK